MGTRNLTCVISGGKHCIAQYGQWDGYPSGQGINILRFLHNGDVDGLREKAPKCVFVDKEDYRKMWKEFGVDIETQSIDMETSDKFLNKYPQFSRDVASNILKMVASSESGLKLWDDYDFAADSLFCEWAYVIDFDKETFEVYKGFNTNSLNSNERFAGMKCKERMNIDDTQYYPVRLVAEFKLTELPTAKEFIEQLELQPDENEGE